MKYAVYPYTLDNLYLSKVSENLLKSDISYIVPGGKVSEVYNSSISMIYSMANIMSMQEVDFDKVIIVDSNMVSYEEYDNAIKVFLEKNIRIILATGIYDEILYSKHSQKRIEICKGNEIVIDSIVHKNKQEIEVPIISVMGDDYVRIVNAKTIFGWTLINGACKKKKPKKMKNYKLTFTRSKDIPYHDRMVELERLYFKKEEERKTYYSTDILNIIFLYLLLIIPGLIYSLVKMHQKKMIKNHNAAINKSQLNYLSEAKSITSASNGQSFNNHKSIPESSVNKPVETRQTPLQLTGQAPQLPADNNKSNINLSSNQSNDDDDEDSFN